ncbi:hypothetical protein [Spirillospora sp. CA-294931]|uniref:hypothetical protein n=1 Tax=Spirillospora sp. CA-294931 TaxID=3240042 RepID=UPI003D920CE6
MIRRLWPFAAALLIAAVGAAVLLLGPRGSEPAAPADLDEVATNTVTGSVSTSLRRVFTYSPSDTASAERAAAEVFSGKAADQYKRLFGQVKAQAPAQRLALTTRVVRAGVTSMDGDTARLLVFLDQTTTRGGKQGAGPAAAQLTVTARNDDGRWLITDLRAA